VILGRIPLARELLRMGSEVIMVANVKFEFEQVEEFLTRL
jgi:hypothetical protein